MPICLSVAFAFALVAAPATADPPAETRVITADGAQRAGLSAGLTRREVGGQILLEAQLPRADGREAVADALRLLATSPDGTQVASADQIGGVTAALTIQRPDGSVAVREMPGVVAAQFSDDGSALFAIDTRGALWRLASATAQGAIVAPGPFDGPITREPSGTVLLRRVSSVEAPFSAHLVRFDPASGGATRLGGDDLVYSAHPLGDGSLAVVAHPIGGATIVSRLTADGATTRIAQLEPAAIAIDVAANGGIAFEVAGDGVYLLEAGRAKPHRLGPGRAPIFSPNGSELLIQLSGGTAVLDLDGSVLARMDAANAGWIACGEGCTS
ncbi:MAG: hypothetical protein M3R05_04965 [Chloroflexota bacterium]|nr:hypothetical protein [Chloroflexota bacterium]